MLRSMNREVSMYVQVVPEMGRGMFALTDKRAGVVLDRYEIIALSPADTIKINQTELKHYTFKLSDMADCLVLGYGEMFNHSDTPNVGYRLVPFETTDRESRKVMEFYTLKAVGAGEQLFIDYNADIRVDVDGYKTSKSLYW